MIQSSINVFAVKWYGESEFWLSMGKVILALWLIVYTFITMSGGNSLHDRFGFRYVDRSSLQNASTCQLI